MSRADDDPPDTSSPGVSAVDAGSSDAVFPDAGPPSAVAAPTLGRQQAVAAGPVLIAGGGIGGLATAIALSQAGIHSHVLERRHNFSDAGAGIQLGPNGTRVLQELGVAALLRPLAGVPEAINVFSGVSGRQLTQVPLGAWIARRHGAPYWVLHRRDLQYALLSLARSTAGIDITTGFSVAKILDDGDLVEVRSDSGQRQRGRALIGADGLWSRTRRGLFKAAPLEPNGQLAARAVVAAKSFDPPFSGNSTGVWLMSQAHVVHYPVHGGRDIAVILILARNRGMRQQTGGSRAGEEQEGDGGSWDAPGNRDELMAQLGPAAAELTTFLKQIPSWRVWSLYDAPPLPSWSKGRVALIGDAAHPMLPFLAQGAVMALEDAQAIAAAIADRPHDLATALQNYDRLRRARATRVQTASRRNGQIYHLAGPARWARDLIMRVTPGARLMQRYDWLYGWRGST